MYTGLTLFGPVSSCEQALMPRSTASSSSYLKVPFNIENLKQLTTTIRTLPRRRFVNFQVKDLMTPPLPTPTCQKC